MNFQNKVVWITGASSGIGRALALELSNQNALLIISARNKASLETVKTACKNPHNVWVLPLDLEVESEEPNPHFLRILSEQLLPKEARVEAQLKFL